MSIALIFAGQGSQFTGMGKDFYEKYESARQVFDSIEMDFDLKDICFNGPEDILNDTAYTQSCILACSMAIYEVLKDIQPSYVAGLSLGEYSALCAAGVFSLKDALEIVRKRGLIMANALKKGTSKMVAVMNTDLTWILEAVKEAGCDIANYNSYNQIVITGLNENVDRAVSILKEKGARRIVPLKVSGAFHSPLLEQASLELNQVLNQYEIKEKKIPVVFNVTGKEENGNVIDLLTKQIKSSVLFYQSIEYMVEKGVDTFIEIGPGHTLSNLIKKINKEVRVFSVSSVSDLEKLKEEL